MSAIIENEDDGSESTENETSAEGFATQLAMVAFRWLPAQRACRRKATSRVWMSHTEPCHTEAPEPPSVRA